MTKQLLLFSVVALMGTTVFGQGGAATNTSNGTNQFLGFDGTTTGTGTDQSLRVRNDFTSRPIGFYTGLNGASPIERMHRVLKWSKKTRCIEPFDKHNVAFAEMRWNYNPR